VFLIVEEAAVAEGLGEVVLLAHVVEEEVEEAVVEVDVRADTIDATVATSRITAVVAVAADLTRNYGRLSSVHRYFLPFFLFGAITTTSERLLSITTTSATQTETTTQLRPN